jgi:hypothetical protein
MGEERTGVKVGRGGEPVVECGMNFNNVVLGYRGARARYRKIKNIYSYLEQRT